MITAHCSIWELLFEASEQSNALLQLAMVNSCICTVLQACDKATFSMASVMCTPSSVTVTVTVSA